MKLSNGIFIDYTKIEYIYRDKDIYEFPLILIYLNNNNFKKSYELNYTNISGLFLAVFGSIAGIKIIF